MYQYKLTIVMYHYVRPILGSNYPGLKGLEFDHFKKQIHYFLNQGYKIINLKDLNSLFEGKLDIKKPLLLTFDDGYIDHYRYVYPFLKSLKLSGVFSPPTNIFLEKKVLDVNKIHFILASEKNTSFITSYIKNFIKINENYLRLKDYEYYFKKLAIESRFDNKNVIFIKRLLQNELPDIIRSRLVQELFEKFVPIQESNLHSELYLNFDQIREMKQNSMDIAGHGARHIWLGKSSFKEQSFEFIETLKFLKSLDVNDNYTFAYPYGSYNSNTLKLMKKYKFNFGFTTIPSLNGIKLFNSHTLARMDTNDYPRD